MSIILATLIAWASHAACADDAALRREAALCRMNLAAVLRHQNELAVREGELRRRLKELETNHP